MYLMTDEQLMSCYCIKHGLGQSGPVFGFVYGGDHRHIGCSDDKYISMYIVLTYGVKEWVLKFSIGLSKINFDSWRVEKNLNGSPDLIL